ncbi:hypothetical protein BD769DRAFT_1388268 [Suillus cothurnatus]|nr:hypothetical protein BD769DRAFT_1388268 [Suillus cothurnatus]
MNMLFNSCPSDFNDATEALLQTKSHTGNTTPSSHAKNCYSGAGTGQGCPTYSCGCYNYNKLLHYQAQAAATDLLDKAPEADIADKPQDDLDLTSKLRLDIQAWKSQCAGQLLLTLTWQKRKHSESNFTQVVTPWCCFGNDLFNTQQGASVPAALEASQKWQKLARAFEERLSLSVAETLLKVVGGIEAAINRQTELLSLILNAMERQGDRDLLHVNAVGQEIYYDQDMT